jgi:hypothetical protein
VSQTQAQLPRVQGATTWGIHAVHSASVAVAATAVSTGATITRAASRSGAATGAAFARRSDGGFWKWGSGAKQESAPLDNADLSQRSSGRGASLLDRLGSD